MFVGGKSCIVWSDERDSILLLVEGISYCRGMEMTEVMKMRNTNCDYSDLLVNSDIWIGIAAFPLLNCFNTSITSISS